MHIVPKLKIQYGQVVVSEDGDLVNGWYFDYEGTSITDAYVSECGRFEVDPVVAYGVTHAQADQLRILNLGVQP